MILQCKIRKRFAHAELSSRSSCISSHLEILLVFFGSLGKVTCETLRNSKILNTLSFVEEDTKTKGAVLHCKIDNLLGVAGFSWS